MKNKPFKKLLTFSTIVTMGVLLSCSTVFAATPIVTAPVNLGTAGNYAILAKTGISTVPNSIITGDIGVSPIASTAITGFSLTVDATNDFQLLLKLLERYTLQTMLLQLPVILLQR